MLYTCLLKGRSSACCEFFFFFACRVIWFVPRLARLATYLSGGWSDSHGPPVSFDTHTLYLYVGVVSGLAAIKQLLKIHLVV